MTLLRWPSLLLSRCLTPVCDYDDVTTVLLHAVNVHAKVLLLAHLGFTIKELAADCATRWLCLPLTGAAKTSHGGKTISTAALLVSQILARCCLTHIGTPMHLLEVLWCTCGVQMAAPLPLRGSAMAFGLPCNGQSTAWTQPDRSSLTVLEALKVQRALPAEVRFTLKVRPKYMQLAVVAMYVCIFS